MTKQQAPVKALLVIQLADAQAVVDYLASKPYGEVAGLINLVNQGTVVKEAAADVIEQITQRNFDAAAVSLQGLLPPPAEHHPVEVVPEAANETAK